MWNIVLGPPGTGKTTYLLNKSEEFLDSGGKNYYYVPCLNDDKDWSKLISSWAK